MKKTVVITGAAKGIGRQLAIEFANNGYNVCANYLNSEKQAKELKLLLNSFDKSCLIYKADISKKEQVDLMIDTVLKNYGSIDVLINNAGISSYGVFQDISQNDLKKMLDINLLGAFNVTQSVLNKYMINKKQGKIINISSMWGITGGSCEVIYSATKAGIIGFTKALAKELAPSNILVNAIAPGVIDTDMIKIFNEEDIQNLKEQIPLQKIGTPQDIANTVMFLASGKADYITGQVISVDGGMVI